jgi:toxin YoeB
MVDPVRLGALRAVRIGWRRSPFKGAGRLEPLKESLRGWWSRRIAVADRLVYRASGKGAGQVLEILSCRFHY